MDSHSEEDEDPVDALNAQEKYINNDSPTPGYLPQRKKTGRRAQEPPPISSFDVYYALVGLPSRVLVPGFPVEPG